MAQADPESVVADALASALLQKTLLCEEDRCFDPASSAELEGGG